MTALTPAGVDSALSGGFAVSSLADLSRRHHHAFNARDFDVWREVFDDDHVAAIVESTPLRRMVEHDELARLSIFLASDLARCITGQFILADAGAFLSRTRPANRNGDSR